MFAYASHGSHVLVQAVRFPSTKAVSTTAAATPVVVVTFLPFTDDARMQCGCKRQVGNKPSAGSTPEALSALLECTSEVQKLSIRGPALLVYKRALSIILSALLTCQLAWAWDDMPLICPAGSWPKATKHRQQCLHGAP